MVAVSFESFFNYIETKSALTLSEDDKVNIQNAFKSKHLRKRQYLLQEGDVCKYMTFFVKGSGCMYSINDKGQYHIVRFAVENWWLGDYESYHLKTPSLYNIEVFEDSQVLMIEYDTLQNLISTVPAIDLMVKEIDKKGIVATQKRIHSSISQSAEESYVNLMRSYPEFLKRFPQNTIASYLGISPETLSRIRKSIIRN